MRSAVVLTLLLVAACTGRPAQTPDAGVPVGEGEGAPAEGEGAPGEGEGAIGEGEGEGEGAPTCDPGCTGTQVCKVSECATTPSTCVEPAGVGELCLDTGSDPCSIGAFHVACADGLDCTLPLQTDTGGQQSVCVAPHTIPLAGPCGVDADCVDGLSCSPGTNRCEGCDGACADASTTCTTICAQGIAASACVAPVASGGVCQTECVDDGTPVNLTCADGSACTATCASQSGFDRCCP